LELALKVPARHCEQSRSSLGPPSSSMYWPGRHSVFVTQAVAGLPSSS
jgi:hypothetical protein